MFCKIKLSNKQRQIAILYICSMLGVLFGVLSSIVNTRFLPPNDYGDVRFVQNFANLGATVLYLGYFISGSRLLALWKDNNEKRNLRGTLIVVLGVTAVILFSFMFFCFIYYSDQNYSLLFLGALPFCLHLLFYNFIINTAQGDNRIGLMAATQLLPYALYVPVAYLIYSQTGVTSNKMMLLQGGVYLMVSSIVVFLSQLSFKNIKYCYKELIIENKNYGDQVYWGSIAMIATTYLAGISIGAFGDNNVEVGFYSLAVTVANPMTMLPSIIGVIFFKDFANLNIIPAKVLKGSFVLTLLSCLFFIILIKPVVVLLYSSQYASVGSYAIWLSIGCSIHGLGDLFGKFLMAHGQGEQVRNSSIYCGVAKLIGYILLVYLWGVNGAILTTIISDSLYFGNMVISYIKYSKF